MKKIDAAADELNDIIKMQKMVSTIHEIQQNELIGTYQISGSGTLIFNTKSYSVIDYINAILGDEYEQDGCTVNAEWYGVPQERMRYIVILLKEVIEN